MNIKDLSYAIKALNNEVIFSSDVTRFYELLSHYNITSNNIGIVGTTNKFNKYMKKIIKKYKNNKKVFIKILNNKVVIIDDDIEITYINIQYMNDLIDKKTDRNIYFKKFLIA